MKLRMIALCLLLCFAAGCSLQKQPPAATVAPSPSPTVDPMEAINREKDRAQAIATVNGEEISKGYLIDLLIENIVYIRQLQQMLGQAIPLTQTELEDMQTSLVDTLVEQTVIRQKAAELGLQLTEAERDEVIDPMDEAVAELKESFRDAAKAEIAGGSPRAATEDELIELITGEYFTANGINIESMVNSQLDAVLYQKVKDGVTKDVQPTEEETLQWYNDKLETDTANVREADTAFEANTAESPVLYAPEGYRYIKQILFAPEAAIGEDVTALETEQQTWTDEMAALIEEDQIKNAQEIDELAGKIAANQADVDQKRGEWLAAVLPEAQDTLEKIQAGEDFDALARTETLNDDPGMLGENNPNGYLVGPNTARFEDNVRAAALALQNVGDVSEPVASSGGYLILQLAGVVQPGAVPYEDVKDIAHANVLQTKVDGRFEELTAEWVDAADIETFPDVYKTAGLDQVDAPAQPAADLTDKTSNKIGATITMQDGGVIGLELYPDLAPQSVRNFVYLARQGFYDGLKFHRIIKDFMIQGGDPTSTGSGGPGYSIVGEFAQNNFANDLAHTRGVISMARSSDFDSAGSQFFIMHGDNAGLDGAYAAFGRVVSGMEVVDAIANTPNSGENGAVAEGSMPVIRSITIDSDAELPEPDRIQ